MCTKTKTSWGCGCSAKDDAPVPCKTAKRQGSSCRDYERYHFKKDGDCRACRHSSDPTGRGMRGEGRYAQEIKRERMRENPRNAYDDTYDRGRTPQPRERTQSTRKARPGYNGGTKANSEETDYNGPEEIEYEYRWDSPSTNGCRRRSRTRDEDVDEVIDLTTPETESRDRRRRARRSSFPSDYGSPAGRSRQAHYQNKEPPRHDNHHRRRRDSLGGEGTGSGFDFVGRMREHCRPARKDKGRKGYEYRDSHRNGDLDDFAVDYEFDHDDLGFDYDLSPRLGRMGSGFSMFPGGRDGFMPSSLFSRRDDSFFDDSFRY